MMTAWTLFSFVLGISLLVGGAELFVRGASRLATMLGVSPLIIGLTVVALGTTAPEIVVCVVASLEGKADLALGNVVGSNILNVLLILGVSATITPLVVSRQIIRLDVPIMIGASVLALSLSVDGGLRSIDGLVLTSLAMGYTLLQIILCRREAPVEGGEFQQTFGRQVKRTALAWLGCGVLIVAGASLLVLGSRWLVDGAVAVARAMGISEMVIGLTIVAVGTSLPEVATSVMASIRGQRDIAVGNVVGSNIYNILAVLGVGALVSPNGIRVSLAALRFDLPVLVSVSIACFPVFFTGTRIARPEGVLFLFYYVVYTVYLILASAHHDALPAFSNLLGVFVIPMTTLGLFISIYRQFRSRRKEQGPKA